MRIAWPPRGAVIAATLGLALCTGMGSTFARAEMPVVARVEIQHLLAFVADSGCEFYRNGSWYDSRRGAEHLQLKLDWLAARNLIQDADDFIVMAATKSSLSSIDYKVRCNGGEAVRSAQWLGDELARFRAASRPAARTASH
jgi:hypothetical protein